MRYLDPDISPYSDDTHTLQYCTALGLEWDEYGVPLDKLRVGDVVVTGPWTDWSWLPSAIGIEVHPDNTPPKSRTDIMLAAMHRFGVPVGLRNDPPKTEKSQWWARYHDAIQWASDTIGQLNLSQSVVVRGGTQQSHIVTDADEARHVLASLHGRPFAFDFETDSLDVRNIDKLGVALATDTESWWVVNGPTRQVLPELVSVLQDKTSEPRASNVPYDLRVLAIAMPGFEPTSVTCWDTQPMNWVDNGGQNFGNDLKTITRQRLRRDVLTFDDAGGPEHFWEQSYEDQAHYAAAGDARNSYDLVPVIKDSLVAKGLLDLYVDIEQPVTPVLAEMELNGMHLDRKILFRLCSDYTDRRDRIESELKRWGFKGTPTNDGHIARYLYTELGLPVLEVTPKLKRGKVSTDVLRRLSLLRESDPKVKRYLPVVNLFIEYSEVDKALSTFLYPPLVSLRDYLYASIKQTSTVTGRISTSNPNIMNIPSRAGKAIREMFTAPDGYELCVLDYSQIEPRIGAHLSQDPSMLRDFREGHDVYIGLGKDMGYGTITKEDPLRQNLKITFLAWLYLTSAPKIQEIALREGRFIPLKEAQAFSDGITKARAGYVQWRNGYIRTARDLGYAKDELFGRLRYVRGLNHIDPGSRNAAERETCNFPNQAGAGSYIKGGMPQMHQLAKEAGGKGLINQIHDELVMVVPPMPKKQREEYLHEASERMIWKELSVPLKVEGGFGPNWNEAKAA